MKNKMTEMEQRIALMICDCDAAGSITFGAAIIVARNVLGAMRAPTQMMMQKCCEMAGAPFPEAAEGYWEAMIDAAMSQ